MPDMIETTPIGDTFVTRLAKMEWVSKACMRFYFCADTEDETILVAKLVVPIDCIAEISAARLRMMAELGAAKGVVVQGGMSAA